MSRHPVVEWSKEVDTIYLYPGQVLTLYLARAHDGLNLVQVEARVTPDGEPQLFSSGVPLKSFDDWSEMPLSRTAKP